MLNAAAAMDSTDFFDCQTLHARMLKAVCVRRQTQGIKCGTDSVYKTIPDSCKECVQGQEIQIANLVEMEGTNMQKVLGTCSNCFRPNMMLTSKIGLCGTCQMAKQYPSNGMTSEQSLAAVAERMKGKEKLTCGRRTIKKTDAEGKDSVKSQSGERPRRIRTKNVRVVEEEVPVMVESGEQAVGIHPGKTSKVEQPEKLEPIVLTFCPDDQALHKAIFAQAKRCRRDPDQQILWMVQNAIEIAEALEKEVAG